jgi:hypothetical protein
MFDYNLSKEQFLDLTPRQFYYIGKRFELKLKRDDYRFGVFTSTLYNLNRGKGKALEPSDFFPSLKDSISKINQKVMSEKQISKTLKMLFGHKK